MTIIRVHLCKNGLVKLIVLWGVITALSWSAYAQDQTDYEEISLIYNIQRIGHVEMHAVIRNEIAYLPLVDLFEYLKINVVSKDLNLISGSFLNPDEKFSIDFLNNRIIYLEKSFELKPHSIIQSGNTIYLRSDYFGEIFGLNCLFNFRSLSVVVTTNVELPIMREMRLEHMRDNLSKLQGVFKADTIVKRNTPLFYFGAADYAFVATMGNHSTPTDTRASLGLGGIIAGGETNVVLNYQSDHPFTSRQQYYLWRYVDNDQKFAKQFLAGKIQSQTISSIYAPIVGAQITNTPTTYRRSFGTYTINNYTEPNWTVELYVNGVLINYVKADAAGFYTFQVPLVYGNTVIKLRFYGPFGEERSTEQNITTPFNFLPKNEFEYMASGGIVEDGKGTRFARFSSNYGLSRHITVGAGIEYLSSLTTGKEIPFVNTSFRLLPNLLISAEYDYNVRSRAVWSYNLPSGLQFEMYNNWYKRGQTAINNTFIEEHKVMVAFPFRGRNFSAYTRLSAQEIRLENTRYNTAEWMLSTVVRNMNVSLNTLGVFSPDRASYVYTNYAVGIRTLRNMLVTQQLQYEYTNNEVVSIKTELEKRIFINGYLNLSYEKNFINEISYVEFGFRYDFSFAQTRFSVRRINDTYKTLQGFNGSLLHDAQSGILEFNNYSSTGKGAVLLIPFLDLNGNNVRDNAEPNVIGLRVLVNAGRQQLKVKDGTVLIKDIEAYAKLNIELDDSGFEKVAWKLVKKNYSVIIEPNFVKSIEIPVSVFGEVAGRILETEQEYEKGLGGILITIYDQNLKKVAQTTSEVDGYFSYLGLLPGNYTAKIEVELLDSLKLKAQINTVSFTILQNIEGSLVDDLKFYVKSLSFQTK